MRALPKLVVTVATLMPLASFAFIETSDCDRSDAETVDGAYNCMMSARYANKRSVFEAGSELSCYSTGSKYRLALQVSGAIPRNQPKEERNRYVPTCEILADALEKIRGERPAWGYCVNYPNRFDAKHMKYCLDNFLRAYHGNRGGLHMLKGCDDAIRWYEKALRDSTRSEEMNRVDAREAMRRGQGSVPYNYQRPACDALVEIGILGADGRGVQRPSRL